MTETPEKLARLRLIRTPSVGPATYHALLARFGSGADAIEALPELARRGGRKKPLVAPPLKDIEKEWRATENAGGRLIFHNEADFPTRLRHTDPAPPVICVKGHAHLLGQKSISMVGARNASANGLRIAGKIAHELSEAGLVIVSGMARGIDGAAHAGALERGTVAVLAGGADQIYPPEHGDLYQAICEQGCIVTEMPIGHTARAKDFPRRNRLISGLSLGTIIVEAALKSGSLITARFALEQDREVYAVPGSPLDPRARGTNRLIKQGAVLVENAEDVLNEISVLPELPLEEPPSNDDFGRTTPVPVLNETDLEPMRQRVIELLGPSPIEIDVLARLSEVPMGALHTILLELDLADRLERQPGQKVALIVSLEENELSLF